jgi:hypothetical protein
MPAQKTQSLSSAKRDLIQDTLAQVRSFHFCGPSDDTDQQTAVTVGFRHLVVQLQRLASPVLPLDVAERLNKLDVEVNNLYSAFDANAEVEALLPDIEAALVRLAMPTTISAKALPVPVCSIVGDVLGTFIFHHSTLESRFYEAGALGEVPYFPRAQHVSFVFAFVVVVVAAVAVAMVAAVAVVFAVAAP